MADWYLGGDLVTNAEINGLSAVGLFTLFNTEISKVIKTKDFPNICVFKLLEIWIFNSCLFFGKILQTCMYTFHN